MAYPETCDPSSNASGLLFARIEPTDSTKELASSHSLYKDIYCLGNAITNPSSPNTLTPKMMYVMARTAVVSGQ